MYDAHVRALELAAIRSLPGWDPHMAVTQVRFAMWVRATKRKK